MFQKILISNIVFVTLLYIFLFIVNPELGNYFLNNNLIENYFPNSNIAYYVPVSDDLYLYLDGIKDFSSIIEYDYNYQNRPLYIASIKFFYFILEKLSFDGLILNFLSFLFFHTLVVTISVVMFVKSYLVRAYEILLLASITGASSTAVILIVILAVLDDSLLSSNP